MNSSVVVLIITAIFALLGIGVIIAAVFFSENKETAAGGTTGGGGRTGMTGVTGICVGPGVPQLYPAPSYTRISPKSTCDVPLSTQTPTLDTVTHSVQRSYRLRSMVNPPSSSSSPSSSSPSPIPISPNHWLGNAMYGVDNVFLAYPYYGRIEDNGFRFGWPGMGVLSETCAADGEVVMCPTGAANLAYDVGWGPTIKLGNLMDISLSCDIVDVDALVGNVIWQYQHLETKATGSISIPIAKGCPYITAEVFKSELTLECDFSFGLIPFEQASDRFTLEISNTSGYLIFLDKPRTMHLYRRIAYLTNFTGVVRIAYYNNTEMYNLLLDHYMVYPIESTIGATAANGGTGGTGMAWTAETTFSWTTASIGNGGGSLLMAALPHHQITNLTTESALLPHPVLSPYSLVTTEPNDEWILTNTVEVPPLAYPAVGTDAERNLFIETWTTEILNIDTSPPVDTVNWCRWVGSLAMMILMGDMLGLDTTSAKTQLQTQLNSLAGIFQNLVYDTTWGGVIGKAGLNDCSGLGDGGNAFYSSHLNQYGYLLFAYAVIGSYNPTFLQTNRETILYFVRDVVNPCASDASFPLWRNKDWYFGYSLYDGLAPNQSRGKKASNVGEGVLGYYGAYLLSTMLTNASDLQTWSLAMLASEVSALQYYFIFFAEDAIQVDPDFVQGTITDRGDTFYDYNVVSGNALFPQRNASMMVPLLKPMNLMSTPYLDPNWLSLVYPWMADALQPGIPSVDPESLATALGILGTEDTAPYTRSCILNLLNSQSSVYLPYGSTWSSFMYWVLSQEGQQPLPAP